MLKNIANEEGFEKFPDFLQQCADLYRNQFLYTKDERFRGAVLALVELRNRVLAERAGEKSKNLTKSNKGVKIKKTY